MKGLNRGLEYIANGINSSKDTRQSIISAANSYQRVNTRIKEIEENNIRKIQDEKLEKIDFDPKEIEPIVLKNENKEER